MSGQNYTNKLANEKSPYLLQHANNPVDWYPWCDEAFSKAREEDKPIFLSIGYSTCHWCHVMERESFEDEEISELLNKDFISIKVDREERPDIDHIYMEVCQALTGRGGWPLTIVMTADKKPFYAGTYFPKTTVGKQLGLTQLLPTITKQWKSNKDKILDSATEIYDVLNKYREEQESVRGKLSLDVVENLFKNLRGAFDNLYGGFGTAPKFPSPHNLLFLLHYGYINNNQDAVFMVERTLEQMYKGGIYDHIGYGFSRYSVDRKWLVPHFEKMLYDNALLTLAYIEAYQLKNDPLYKQVVEETLEYVSRVMTDKEGGFYTAEDADSEGEEGKFYTFTKNEIKELLDKEDATFIIEYYNISEEGNFERTNILNLIHKDYLDLDDKERERLNKIKERLFNYRDKRVHPHKDDKILTSWNAMMITAYARAGRVLNNDAYINKAKQGVQFISDHLIDENGRIQARYRDGEAKFKGYIDDYAYLNWALIELFLGTSDQTYIHQALKLTDDMIELFWDDEKDGFYYYGNDSEYLLMRNKEIYDGAIPSGNSIATMNFIKLSEITDEIKYEKYARKLFDAFAYKVKQSPSSHSYMLNTYLHASHPKTKVVIVGKHDDPKLKEIKRKISHHYLPLGTVLILYKDLVSADDPIFGDYLVENKDIACYICQDYSCDEPIYDYDEICKEIDNL
ncbi:thioredoxin domain-containing protein [Haloplasma contractile]|uniref:Thioredoxin protein n=1 Tax=Haloplasma contractile SSD-17B TaxID=1033810 RepID=U2FI02_9MOLU|nr:thioredoxin domain-containing protein [Haloplasma contractile]ERJ12445.1 Thioredoxin protein [Haloplasma contractile SSD-17B]